VPDTDASTDRFASATLARFLRPERYAVVGASERLARLRHTVFGDPRAVLVNPRADRVFGRPTIPDLGALDGPVDAVLCLTAAAHATAIVDDVATAGGAGLVVFAAGFRETGENGAALQHELRERARARGIVVMGPNCVGFHNLVTDSNLFVGPMPMLARGPVGVISQSGGVLETMALRAERRVAGFSHLITTGNEAVSDLTDYLEFLVDDEDTDVIALLLEQVRRPVEFRRAMARANERGKVVVALRLGRSDRAARINASHTGAIAGDVAQTEAALRHLGVAVTLTLDEMVAQLEFLSRLEASRWRPTRGVAVLAVTGGWAALASDEFEKAGVPLPEGDQVQRDIEELVPGSPVANPLDVTAATDAPTFERILRSYDADPAYDTISLIGHLRDEDVMSRYTKPLRDVAATSEKRFLYLQLDPAATVPACLDGTSVGVLHGLRPAALGLRLLNDRARHRPPRRVDEVERRPSPPTARGMLLPFADTMRLLDSFGLPVAPYHLWSPDNPVGQVPGDHVVVKLADIAHRTDIGAVRLGVPRDRVSEVAVELRRVADEAGVPEAVVVQAQASAVGEVFVGLVGGSSFGPMIAVGPGGVLVELLGRPAMRLAPISEDEALELVDETALGVLSRGVRGSAAWNREILARTLVSASELIAACRGWVDTVDLNPLIVTHDGVVVVDAAVHLSRSET
jgi:acyl-CoA synthetase (NDP forming)